MPPSSGRPSPARRRSRPRGAVVDLFAGAGGWDVALDQLGWRSVGIEIDRAACQVATAAGHARIRADVTTYPTERFAGATGLVASPPCQSFSQAGKRSGLADPRGQLVWEPVRWVEAVRPEWVCLEEVPRVEPIWRLEAERLRTLGYSTWVGVVDAANFGAPQNRKRAVLVASRLRSVAAPVPTHCQGGRPAGTNLFGPEPALAPWVAMAEALDWGWDDSPARTICGARQPRWLYRDPDGTHGAVLRTGANTTLGAGRTARYERDPLRPAPTVTANAARSWKLQPRSWADGRGGTSAAPAEQCDEPAPTIALGHDLAGWCWTRPATTVQGTPRIAQPGHHDRQWRDAVDLSIPEMGVLQGFGADHPWGAAGTKTAAADCVGNAIPPPLAAALIVAAAGD